MTPNSGPQVSLTTAVESRYVNTFITRMEEPDHVPLTTNLGLKYNRRMLYFLMDFGELTIDGLVDTGALSSAIPETEIRKILLLAPQSIIKESFSSQPPNNDCNWAVGKSKEHCRTEI